MEPESRELIVERRCLIVLLPTGACVSRRLLIWRVWLSSGSRRGPAVAGVVGGCLGERRAR